MPYHFEAAETLSDGARRVAREQLDDALSHLRGASGRPEDERVHEARKSLKKVRALLRLLREEIGEETYRRENVALRDAGRKLSPVRDAQVLVETFESLAEEADAQLPEGDLAPIRSRLIERREETRSEVLGDGSAFQDVARAVAAARDRVEDWPIERDGATGFAGGLEKTYERGRDRLAHAYEVGTTEAFHEWRKRVKYHWYHLRLLRDWAPGDLAPMTDRADELADLLGIEHDLAVLAETIRGMDPAYLPSDRGEAILELIGRRRDELQCRARPLGEQVYAGEPQLLYAEGSTP